MTNYTQELWEIFWQGYPRKEAKKKAEKAFKRLSKKKQLAAIEDSKKRYVGTGRHKCHMLLPTSYLNGERWEDDPIPKREEKPADKGVFAASHKQYKPEW